LSADNLRHLRDLCDRSVEIIRANQHDSGAYVACPSFPVYRYCWFRDGAFIADAMSRIGEYESAEAFFDWCSRVLVSRSSVIGSVIARAREGEEVADTELLPCRYRLDGDDDDEPWTNFQLDGYGTWLWALSEHLRRSGRSTSSLWRSAAGLTVDYLSAFWSRPCYDWWEEHGDKRHVGTLGAIVGGLEAIAREDFVDDEHRRVAQTAAAAARDEVLRLGVQDGHLCKWYGTNAVDASLLSCIIPFRLVEPEEPIAQATLAAVETDLVSVGVHRYLADTYYGGGEWLLLSAFLGWQQLAFGRADDAATQLSWIAAQAEPNGYLPEQVAGHLLAADREAEWIASSGPVASPLLWSHAMFITLAAELGIVPESAPDRPRFQA